MKNYVEDLIALGDCNSILEFTDSKDSFRFSRHREVFARNPGLHPAPFNLNFFDDGKALPMFLQSATIIEEKGVKRYELSLTRSPLIVPSVSQTKEVFFAETINIWIGDNLSISSSGPEGDIKLRPLKSNRNLYSVREMTETLYPSSAPIVIENSINTKKN